MTRILVKFPYAVYTEVTATELGLLLNFPKYSSEGYYENEKFYPLKADILEQLEIKYVRDDKFPTTEQTVIDIEAILAENTRLTREKDILQAAYDKLVNKTGTELQSGDN